MKRFDVPETLQPVPVIIKAADLGLCGDLHSLAKTAEADATRWRHAARTAFRVARKDGRSEGYEAGLKAANETMADLAKELSATLVETRSQVAEIALSVVRKVIGDLPGDLVWQGLIETALADCRSTDMVTVAISADAPAERRETIEAVIARSAVPARLDFDAALPPDGCEMRIGTGFVDISFDRQLDILALALAAGDRDD